MIRPILLALAALLLPGAVMAADPPRPLLTWSDLKSRPRPTPTETLTYGSDPLQKVDLWLPEGKSPRPVAIMVHGGCWQSDIADRTLMDWIADDLRRHGVAVWNIDYRGVDRAGGGYPGTFQDVTAAADLLRKEAARYDLDLSHVVAIGHSAGGHLALWLAARAKLPRTSPLWTADPLPITRAISLGGLPDLAATETSPDNGCGTPVVARLTGDHADRFADTSIPPLLPLGVAQDLVNGREDRIIPYRFATDYVAQARKAGDSVTLHTVPATGHVELIAPDSAAWRVARQIVLDALR
ncbi:alpha/beta hydrolase [Sphingomonas sp. KR1UV-12]|uniref:Alpha/beta hydrolase n=1 Tax=Sphingomonas aurea TaxID=3063994 RepID=A0ABT9EIN9_9SPHN|nr:alpha/beta hydrolase [Sphingomonas sp. KR1UV-12]MDP1026764.1 alpha/beta hydrolase [Sphingomonas sp. KR1UV-12]